MRTILDQIQWKYQALSKTEKRIADYIIKHNEDLLNIHIKELAKKIAVSDATITRFCKKIGAANLEFKILLRDAVKQTDTTDHAIHHVNQMYKSIISSTNALTEMKTYQTACQWILAADKIYVYGLRSSGLSAEELKYRLSRMGLHITSHRDSHSMVIASSMLTKQDVVIAISNSGQTKEIVEAIELAKRKQATIISITNYLETPLAVNSDLTLYTSGIGHYIADGFFNSQLSILYSLDILSKLISANQPQMEAYQETLHALDEYKKI